MDLQFHTHDEYREVDDQRDWLCRCLTASAHRRALMRQFIGRRLLPAEEGLLSLVPAGDRGDDPSRVEAALAESVEILFDCLDGTGTGLDLDSLRRLGAAWTGTTGFRRVPARQLFVELEAEEPDYLNSFLETTLQWFAESSITALHPVEKSALMTLRLLDLLPFPAWNFYLVRLISWYYLLEADILPPWPDRDAFPGWVDALQLAQAYQTANLMAITRDGVLASFRHFRDDHPLGR